MPRSALARIHSRILTRPRSVLVVCGILVVLSLWLGSRVELRTSRSELAPADDPDQRRWEALLSEYKGSEAVIACLEALADGPGEPERFADALALRLAGEPLVERVFHRFDTGWFHSRAPYLVPAATRDAVTAALAAESELIRGILSARDLAELNRMLADRLRAQASAAGVPDSSAARGTEALLAVVEAQRDLLADPDGWLSRHDPAVPLVALFEGGRAASSDGYLRTHDGRTLFLLITPRDTDDSVATRRHLLARLREHVELESRRAPGYSVVFTGAAAMTVEEMETVRRDGLRTSLIAILAVGGLTLLVFRWRSHALLVMLSLGVGVVWALGAVEIELGYLNLITTAFVSTLVGVGVAYGIHPVSEYELEGAHTRDPVATVRESFRRTAPAVTAAGLTTAAAFFSILLMRFRGFAELGLVAGVGVLLCLAAALVLLPALLLLYGGWRHRRDRAPREAGAAMDRFWLERMAGRVCRFPLATCAIALGVSGLMAVAARGLSFDTNILDLLPEQSESVRYQKRMTLASDLSPLFNLAVAEDLDDLRSMRERSMAEPSIARFESALRFLPDDPVAARRAVDGWWTWLDAAPTSAGTAPLEPQELVDSLGQLETVLEELAEAAFTGGAADLAVPLDQARAAVRSSRLSAAAADPDKVEGWNRAQQSLRGRMDEAAGMLREAAGLAPPSVENLPAAIRERFFTSSGKPIALLYPAGSVFEPQNLDDYVAASLRVSGDAIGFPFMFHKMSGRITTGFYRAVIAGAVLVLSILIANLRSVRDALLAAAPLAIGLLWTAGAMPLLGLSFNFANLVAVPLIIGVGIDNGVHVIHRVRLEGRAGIGVVLRHTGRAILIASLTTMAGFGSLALASHRGLASLGLVLLLGVGSCLITSTIVLPNLLVLLGTVER